MDLSAVIPTKGDVDLTHIIKSIKDAGIKDVVIADYGQKVYNRFLGVKNAKHNIIYTQDDDCIVDVKGVIDSYIAGIVVNNMPIDRRSFYNEDITLIGWGAIFDKNLVNVLDGWEHDDLFMTECDRIFTALNKHKEILVDFKSLDYASDTSRLSSNDTHWEYLKQIKQRIYEKVGRTV